MKILAILILLAFSTVTGCNYYGDYRAKSFCSKIPIGSSISVLVSTEKSENLRHYTVEDTGAYRYSFGGYIFSAGICEVSIVNDKVSAKRFYHFDLR